ncbi:MAG: hypothetical protein JNM85_07145 [Chthonomonas sp.]|nr:hypothetical protein [Chthonomonas sp.]
MAQNKGLGPSRHAEEILSGLLDGFAKATAALAFLGLIASAGLMFYYIGLFGGDGGSSAPIAAAMNNLVMARKALLASCFALGVSTTYLFWGDEVTGIIQALFGALLQFIPLWLPIVMAGANSSHTVVVQAMSDLQSGGLILLVIGVIVELAYVAGRVKDRIKHGTRSDLMKYGKGIKSESIQNVFMGKCWQLPFCRKFVREQCPIYHSRRTCWKERVGCMCEEKVIKGAMEGIQIPRDALLAAKYIPYSHTISKEQKMERCRQCVIYNEHQRHKYKLSLPIALATVIGLYALLRPALLAVLERSMAQADKVISSATLREATGTLGTDPGGLVMLREVLLVCLMLVVMAYILKILEYVFFNLKL